MLRWLTARRSPRTVPIDSSVWHGLASRYRCLQGLDAAESDHMRAMIAAFLSSKTFSGAQGLVVDDAMRLAIAAQACLPVLRIGLDAYDDFVEIVVYPSAFKVRRRYADADGLVHDFDDVLAGEAMDGGPIVLSWDDVDVPGDRGDGNVVIHEFAHKLDLADGEADGCPPMPASRREAWLETLLDAYERFGAALDEVEASIPADVDPESEAADECYAVLPLDPYAATDPSEFFAVAVEAFFVEPSRLAAAFPALFEAFSDYFRQDRRGPGVPG